MLIINKQTKMKKKLDLILWGEKKIKVKDNKTKRL